MGLWSRGMRASINRGEARALREFRVADYMRIGAASDYC